MVWIIVKIAMIRYLTVRNRGLATIFFLKNTIIQLALRVILYIETMCRLISTKAAPPPSEDTFWLVEKCTEGEKDDTIPYKHLYRIKPTDYIYAITPSENLHLHRKFFDKYIFNSEGYFEVEARVYAIVLITVFNVSMSLNSSNFYLKLSCGIIAMIALFTLLELIWYIIVTNHLALSFQRRTTIPAIA